MPTPMQPGAVPARDVAGRRGARRETLRLLVRKKEFIVGAAVMLIWIVCAVGGTAIAPHDPYQGDPAFGHAAPGANGGSYVLGTDRLGRDVLSRIIVGARDILVVAPVATLLGTVLGTVLGLLTGYFRGAVDDVLSRIIDAFLALPVIIVGLT